MSRKLNDIRVVALLGNNSQHKNTLATLIKNGINVVGVCIVDEKRYGIPLKYILRIFEKRGFFTTLSCICARALYLFVNGKLDKKLEKKIFNNERNRIIISNSNFKKSFSYKFDDQKEFISKLKPDILIVHTKSWVSKRIRNIKGVKYIIGGHPGITQLYRGSQSSFWAIYNNDISNIGWTTFLLDEGVDTGPIIDQGFIKPKRQETYVSLSLRAMKSIAESQVNTIKSFAKNGTLNFKKNKKFKNKNSFCLPTLKEQILYWRKQKLVK